MLHYRTGAIWLFSFLLITDKKYDVKHYQSGYLDHRRSTWVEDIQITESGALRKLIQPTDLVPKLLVDMVVRRNLL